ncbi:MAG: nitrate reductase [Haliea sp.]|nr:nitrate reductase [Haliea sp.]
MSASTHTSFCRLCMGHCGVKVSRDDAGRITAVEPDREDPFTLGYACFKGMQAAEAHNSPERILRPLKRLPDGSFEPIGIEQALDEIAERLDAIRQRKGPVAIGGYKGGGAFFTSSSLMMLNDWLRALGSPKAFSTVTIDQSAKYVTAGRLGVWPAGRDPFHRGDVFMIVGGNPLVSVSTVGFDTRNPAKRLRQAQARGMKLIVIDPRRTETARAADVFLQPLPGEDAVLLAGMLRLILERGWHDRDFCAQHVGDLDTLREQLQPFTLDLVAQRTGVPAEQIVAATELFAHQSRRGAATSATGPDMSPHSNLAEHLVELLNVVCGRFIRAGEEVPNPGALLPRWPRKAEVMPAPRWWEQGYRSRFDYGLLDGELPTGSLLDEILEPAPDQLRALIVHGGNPALAMPDLPRTARALESLELLVTIDHRMTATAELSDYILPPTLQYERPDLPMFIYEPLLFPEPFTRYTPAIAAQPPGSELKDDWYYFWGLGKRLGLQLEYWGQPLDMVTAPTTEDLLRIAAQHCPHSLEEIARHPHGLVVEGPPEHVEPGDPDSPNRFTTMPADVAAELAAALQGSELAAAYAYRLAARRERDALNSACRDLPAIRRRLPDNPAWMNPEDMQAEGLQNGDRIAVASPWGQLETVAREDANLRRGVISITHGFGGVPGRTDPSRDGVSVNLLTSSLQERQPINAMPRMSGLPVNIHKVGNCGEEHPSWRSTPGRAC